jgi:phosphoesterase RecJ-like protein
VIFPETLNTVVIDHHASNAGFGKINLVDPTYSSVCQIVFDLFGCWSVPITEDMATCLLMGIYTDSGGFKYPPTNFQTFEVASKLSKIAPNYNANIFKLENSNEPEQIKFLGLALTSIRLFFRGQVAISMLPFEQFAKNNLLPRHSEKMEVANTLKSVVDWKIGASFIETEKNIVNVSFRTQDPEKFDVAKIAVATGSGGGHKAAAGTRLTMPFEEAKKFLLETIQKVYPELGTP